MKGLKTFAIMNDRVIIMPHFIIGTAGHVDHGKSALVEALTGTDPDRLPQEKERGLTIELGFATIVLPSGIECGIVDVPGHEKYLKNMLAGVGGFDFTLLVIDAGEGVKEQTREHLDIMQLLEIKDGLTVITKIDRVSPETVDQVENEIIEFLKGSFLYDSPIVRVSSATGEGLESLIYLIDQRIVRLKPRPEKASLRIPVDRVFKKPGFGTIVTGTIYQGKVKEFNKVLVLPDGLMTKIRQMQVYNKKVKEAFAGQRVALNLSGIDSDEIFRGDQIVTPGTARATGRMDVSLTVLESSPHPLLNRFEVRLHLATSEIFAKVILLDRDVLEQGEKCFAQIIFRESMTVFPGDRFIMRAPSAIYTIGGGVVLEPYPRKHRRFDKKALELLEIKEKGDPSILLEKIMQQEPYHIHSIETIAGMLSLPTNEIAQLLKEFEDRREIIRLSGEKFLHHKVMEKLKSDITEILSEFEKNDPGRLGSKPDELRLNIPKMEDRLFRELIIYLKSHKLIKEKNGLISSYDFTPGFDEEHEKCYGKVILEFRKADYKPPTADKLASIVNFPDQTVREVIDHMLFRKELVRMTGNILFLEEHIKKARKPLAEYIIKHGGITPSEARIMFNSTRKYIIPMLEYFDRIYFTRRDGNKRVLLRSNIYVE